MIYTVHMTQPTDLNRQLVKSGFATVSIPELAIEIPAKRGQLTTVEGILSDTLRDLEIDQPVRKHVDPPTYEKIEALCQRLRDILGEGKVPEDETEDAKDTEMVEAGEEPKLRSHGPVGSIPTRGGQAQPQPASADPNRTFPPFSVRLDDPSGNSFIEFLGEITGRGVNDNKWTKRDYPRTKEQNELLGLAAPPTAEGDAMQTEGGDKGAQVSGFSKEAGETEHENEEIYSFPGTCSSCNAPLQTLMKKVNIPYFKDVLIMSTNCDYCGYRDNEVKSGAAISEHGRKLTLQVQDSEDLSRDILKSETAGLEIPEIELHLAPGTLGGRFTTLEGLLQQVFDELSEKVMAGGDSSRVGDRTAFEDFLGKLKGVMTAAHPFTLILDDPLSNSYIQNPYAPDVDEQVTIEVYERDFEQNEELGLNDIKVSCDDVRGKIRIVLTRLRTQVENYSEESKLWAAQAEAAKASAGVTRKADEISAAPAGKDARQEGAEAIKKPRVDEPDSIAE